jgi:hypothetical protein
MIVNIIPEYNKQVPPDVPSMRAENERSFPVGTGSVP